MLPTPDPGIPNEGDVFLGKYRVERVLGRGGMGVVVAARHLAARRPLRHQVSPRIGARRPRGRRALPPRGPASRRILSEHVVRVYDVGTMDNGAPYMVMEYLDGNDLGYLLEKGGPLAVDMTVDYVLQACEALAEAHAAGIVHRDLKPSNLFVSRRADGSALVKVLDFGISKVSDAAGQDVGMTKTHAVMGSPRYMSPEHVRSTRGVDARSDIWALGAILHELLSGTPVFRAEGVTELCAQILQDAAPPLRAFRPDVPPGLEAVVLRCLEKSPAGRFENVALLAQALTPFGSPDAQRSAERISRVLGAAGQRITENPPQRASIPPASTQAPAARTATAWGDESKQKKAGKDGTKIIWGIGTLALVAGGVAAVVILQGGAGPKVDANAKANATANVTARPTESAAAIAPATTTASSIPTVASTSTPTPSVASSETAPSTPSVASTSTSAPPPVAHAGGAWKPHPTAATATTSVTAAAIAKPPPPPPPPTAAATAKPPAPAKTAFDPGSRE